MADSDKVLPTKGLCCTNPKCSFLTVTSPTGENCKPKRLGLNDTHTLCLRCLGADHEIDKCGVCQSFHKKTLRARMKAVAQFKRSGIWPETYKAHFPCERII